jgi:hypothetical protein
MQCVYTACVNLPNSVTNRSVFGVNSVNIEKHMTFARQRLGENIPEITLSTIERRPLPGIGTNNHAAIKIRDKN